jgi:hypothetical protein
MITLFLSTGLTTGRESRSWLSSRPPGKKSDDARALRNSRMLTFTSVSIIHLFLFSSYPPNANRYLNKEKRKGKPLTHTQQQIVRKGNEVHCQRQQQKQVAAKNVNILEQYQKRNQNARKM